MLMITHANSATIDLAFPTPECGDTSGGMDGVNRVCRDNTLNRAGSMIATINLESETSEQLHIMNTRFHFFKTRKMKRARYQGPSASRLSDYEKQSMSLWLRLLAMFP